MRIRNNRAELIVAAAAALWGLFWIPLRALERQGLEPEWVTLSQFIAPLVCLLPFVIYKLFRGEPAGFRQYGTGLLVGTAFALYCESLLLTDVIRALILFYVAPAWGTLLEVAFMGRKFTYWRALALALSMLGLIAILSAGDGPSFSINVGDVMALLSGILFSIGAMRIRQKLEASVFEQLFAFFFYGALATLLLLQIFVAQFNTLPSLEVLEKSVFWVLLMAAGFLIPVMAGIFWGSRLIDPGRLGILLQLEAIVGISSAAIFAGERFGILEATGSILVIGAGLVEILGNRPKQNDFSV